MRLHAIVSKFPDMTTLDMTIELLRLACEDVGYEFSLIFSDEFDFSSNVHLTSDDMLYCLTEDFQARLIENIMINDQVKSFYSDIRYCYGKIEDGDDITSMLVHRDHGLPTIDTIPAITGKKELMQKYVEKLGGLPVVIKAVGNTSHGLGTMRLDSWPSLFSVTDYLLSQTNQFVLKSYINVKRHVRVIVLGDKVIDCIEYQTPLDDFRSNTGVPQVQATHINGQLESIAVGAINSLGYRFGGVDLLIDQQSKPWIAEVNFPCYFGRVQQTTGTPIAKMMLEYLASH